MFLDIDMDMAIHMALQFGYFYGELGTGALAQYRYNYYLLIAKRAS